MEQEPQTSVLGLLIIIIRALLLCQNATNRLNIFMINIHASPVLSQTYLGQCQNMNHKYQLCAGNSVQLTSWTVK